MTLSNRNLRFGIFHKIRDTTNRDEAQSLLVWESIEHLREYVYRSARVEVLRNRHEWFSKFESSYLALWWVPIGHRPSIDEAKKRLAYLADNGPTSFAFTFKITFPPDPTVVEATDWSAFEPCPVVTSWPGPPAGRVRPATDPLINSANQRVQPDYADDLNAQQLELWSDPQ
jgi:hypothetical protein